jgi:membrane protease YdiL (CAAX protease family)
MVEAADRVGNDSSRSIWTFLVLTCLLSWPVWQVSGVLPRGGAGPYDLRWLIAQVGVFGPTLAALVVSFASGGELRKMSLRAFPLVLAPLVVPGVLIARAAPATIAELPLLPSVAAVVVATLVVAFFSPLNRRPLLPATGDPHPCPSAGWIVLSVVLLPALFIVAWLLAGSRSGGLEISALHGGPTASVSLVLVVFAHNLLLGGSLGEEIGWRGFLLPELLRRMSPLAASVVVGVVWGLWHLPVDLYAGFGLHGIGAVVARVVYAVPMSILFTWFFLRTGGSLLVALLLHTSLNVMGDLGVSSFEATSVVFFLMVAVAAAVVGVSSPEFRHESGPSSRPSTGPSKLST